MIPLRFCLRSCQHLPQLALIRFTLVGKSDEEKGEEAGRRWTVMVGLIQGWTLFEHLIWTSRGLFSVMSAKTRLSFFHPCIL